MIKLPLRFLALILTTITLPIYAQDRAGNNTAGEWLPSHYKVFDQWDSVCDKRGSENTTEQRCYIRYVDVYSDHPKFGAVFLFVTPEKSGHKIEVGFERGTRYMDQGFQLEVNGAQIWAMPEKCLRTKSCVLTGDNAAEFIAKAQENENAVLAQRFTDRYKQSYTLNWQMNTFLSALNDFEIQTEIRALR